MKFNFLAILGIVLVLWQPGFAQDAEQSIDEGPILEPDRTAKIGVLAYRGPAIAREEWLPLGAYLTDRVEGWTFQILPVTLSSVHRAIADEEIDFLVTNSGHFVTLAAQYDLSALATRDRWGEPVEEYLSSFGTAIFVTSDSAITSLNDVKGASVAAVGTNAFGGFQIAWNEMLIQGVDVFRDLKSLRFVAFPQDQIVTAVAVGEVDVGIVRSGLLESLAQEGKINLDDFRVLNRQGATDFPHMVSSALYPEWPFIALQSADKSLREQVMIALLQSQDASVSAEYGLQDKWSAPLSYERVRILIRAYQQRIDASHRIGRAIVWSMVAAALGLVGSASFAVLYWRRRRDVMQGGPATYKSPIIPAEFRAYENRLESLTKREQEILSLICSGYQTKSIAAELGISTKTVEFHRTNLLKKSEAGTMAHLVQIATHLGYDLGLPLGKNTTNPVEAPS